MAIKCKSIAIYDNDEVIGVALRCQDPDYFNIKCKIAYAPKLSDIGSESELDELGFRLVFGDVFVTNPKDDLNRLFENLGVGYV